MSDQHASGSVGEFDAAWKGMPPTDRYHFRAGEPLNQLHYAFQSHWRVFQKVLGDVKGGRALEVGCGRGSMGAYFANAGFETHLLDSSEAALASAKRNFTQDGLSAHYHHGDALALPFPDGHFNAVVSIGLLEHFENIRDPLAEQMRVLAPGGVFLGYVVPERPISVQTLAAPVNAALKLLHRREPGARPAQPKQLLYRSSYWSKDYLDVVRQLGAQSCGAFGMFPVPLISHSPSFPFSLMGPAAERRVVSLWQSLIGLRGATTQASGNASDDPWTCPEWWGLAFLVWAKA